MTIDAIVVADHTVVIALDNLVERGLDPQRAYLFVIDGSKALRKAIRDTFGARVLVQRCQEHKRRNVLAQLPKKLYASVNKVMHDAYRSPSKTIAKRRLTQLIKRLEETQKVVSRAFMPLAAKRS